MRKVKVLYKSPGGTPFVRTVKISGTRYIQDRGTGQMRGRRSVKNGETITRKRVKKSFALVTRSKNARGHVRKVRTEHSPGQFF